MNAPANLPARLPMPPTVATQGITSAQWKVLTEAIFPGAQTPEAVELAIAYCKSRNLDIMKRPVHIVTVYSKEKKGNVETIWPGVNEVQVTAARTKQWAGMDPPRFGPDVTMTFHGEKEAAEVTFPEWCEVTVYRMVEGQRCGFTETVYWLETYSRKTRWDERPNEMWARRSRGQLAKCAKAASLRAAFPEEGELTAEEMEGKEVEAGGVLIDAQAEPVGPDAARMIWKIADDKGEVQHVCASAGDALRRYGEVKEARTDKAAVAANNLEMLRVLATLAKNGQRTRLENEIAAAEAYGGAADGLPSEGEVTLGTDEDELRHGKD